MARGAVGLRVRGGLWFMTGRRFERALQYPCGRLRLLVFFMLLLVSCVSVYVLIIPGGISFAEGLGWCIFAEG